MRLQESSQARRRDGQRICDEAKIASGSLQLHREILRHFVIGIRLPEVERNVCSLTDTPDLEKALQLASQHEAQETNLNGLHG